MAFILQGDCLNEMKDIDKNSVDLIFADLPYGETSCKWDSPINLHLFWKEILRIKKKHTPIIFTTTTKFGVSLINSAPKKCPFRYDCVWCKSASTSFLLSSIMPLKKHEMLYFFYEKKPLYDISSHKHKFKIEKELTEKLEGESIYEGTISVDDKYREKGRKKGESAYNPPLPTSVIKETICENFGVKRMFYTDENGNIIKEGQSGKEQTKYNPPLPTSLLEIPSKRGNHSTQKPVDLMKWILKYYSKEGDIVLDPTMGSGSMGVACLEMKRNFIGFELDCDIFGVAYERLNIEN